MGDDLAGVRGNHAFVDRGKLLLIAQRGWQAETEASGFAHKRSEYP
jgi:hypothetical protein